MGSRFAPLDPDAEVRARTLEQFQHRVIDDLTGFAEVFAAEVRFKIAFLVGFYGGHDFKVSEGRKRTNSVWVAPPRTLQTGTTFATSRSKTRDPKNSDPESFWV
jgi:hypothetical protein